MKAWYFSKPDKRLAYGDGRKIRVGTTHKVDGQPELCFYGLHGSVRLIDALTYAHSTYLYRVEIEDSIVEGNDKLCGKSRKYLAYIDAERILLEFARKQALINIEKIKPYCSESDYNLILKWLETGDKKLRLAAYSAADSAAYSAADSAARSAAYSAADSAAYSAADSAARSAAKSAAYSAADSAAYSDAKSAAWLAADSAVCLAAKSSADSAANEMLEQMVFEALTKQGYKE